MARHRRFRRHVGKAAGAFAPAEGRTGKTISWESLLDNPVPEVLSTFMTTQVRDVGTVRTRLRTLIPGNVTRGAVTLERVRGTVAMYFSSLELAANFVDWPVQMSLQLVPLRDGAIDVTAALSLDNAADQESTRIVWQRLYYGRAGTTITGPGALELHESNYVGQEVDIKVRRRFARDSWALALVSTAEAGVYANHVVGGILRALFRSGDGI